MNRARGDVYGPIPDYGLWRRGNPRRPFGGVAQRLNLAFPGLIAATDFFAGTSTGSFIAAGPALGLHPDQIADLHSERNGRFIFTPERPGLVRPKYGNTHLRAILASVFPGGLRLNDLQRRVLIPSFRVTGDGEGFWAPVFFNNFPSSDTGDEPVLDVLLSSSAAPVYFPSYRNHIDGGVIANNPSTAAVAIAVDRRAGSRRLEDIRLLSIGTGFSPLRITADTALWGALQWMFYPSPGLPLISVMTEGVNEADSRFTAQLLGERYFRLNPVFSEPIPLDDYKKIPDLTALGENFDLGPVTEWIRWHWF